MPAVDALVAETAVNLRFHHAMSSKAKLRTYAGFLYQAGSWRGPAQGRGSARMLAAAGRGQHRSVKLLNLLPCGLIPSLALHR